jgi:hypothetical protein
MGFKPRTFDKLRFKKITLKMKLSIKEVKEMNELSDNARAILRELVRESRGLGWGVAVYPFETNIRTLNIPQIDANLAIVELQRNGLVQLDERTAIDPMTNQPHPYPVYVLTVDGFQAYID